MPRLSLLFLLVVSLLPLRAEESPETPVLRPVTSAFMLEGGSSHVADTYLSPLRYSGWSAAFGYERLQAMRFSPDAWIMRLTIDVSADRTQNPVRNSAIWGCNLGTSWAMMRRWKPFASLPDLTLGAGPQISFDLGALYNSRNGNNPVAAKAALTVGATGYAAYNLRLGRLRTTLRYQPSLPLTGAFFAPEYGELYYEIYLGNHKGLAHWGWPGNYFRFDNLVTADFHFGATSLRLGYSGSVLSTKVNDITTRQIFHRLVVGISGEWISLSPRCNPAAEKARIVSALY